jgi:hypothetical protein
MMIGVNSAYRKFAPFLRPQQGQAGAIPLLRQGGRQHEEETSKDTSHYVTAS